MGFQSVSAKKTYSKLKYSKNRRNPPRAILYETKTKVLCVRRNLSRNSIVAYPLTADARVATKNQQVLRSHEPEAFLKFEKAARKNGGHAQEKRKPGGALTRHSEEKPGRDGGARAGRTRNEGACLRASDDQRIEHGHFSDVLSKAPGDLGKPKQKTHNDQGGRNEGKALGEVPFDDLFESEPYDGDGDRADDHEPSQPCLGALIFDPVRETIFSPMKAA